MTTNRLISAKASPRNCFTVNSVVAVGLPEPAGSTHSVENTYNIFVSSSIFHHAPPK
jgi:hypothetical protein